ncbi:MAG: RagB/SusD family nutrient uptake outer membrane protein [Marinifilaceae bacterium]|jgi:hypothetical protein|nr:RagB/SusD family nutrient uptake outer membrane protein [Marinifilaceae bacterium]
MKHYILAILILGLSSCSDFLDIDDKTKISTDELFSTIKGTASALNGVYYSLGDNAHYGENYPVISDLKSGNLNINDMSNSAVNSLYYQHAYEFTHIEDDSQDDRAENIYRELYKTMNSVNTILANIKNIKDASDEELLQAEAEARALRALVGFDLTRYFAQSYSYTANAQHNGIAYLDHNVKYDESFSRDLLFDNYEYIIEDLKFAEQNLKTPLSAKDSKVEKTYFSALAAKALLARVYLYKEDWQNAINYATEVIDSPDTELVPNADLVDSYNTFTPNSEDIFIVDKSEINNAAPMSSVLGVNNNRSKLNLSISNDLYSLYEDADARKLLFEAVDGEYVSKKYPISNTSKDRYFPVLRLAEMYLIRAEASVNLPKADEPTARNDMDIIRRRANPAIDKINLFGKNLKAEIFNERRRELALEGHLFFDYSRKRMSIKRVDYNGNLNQNLDYPNNFFVLPIPEDAQLYNPQMEPNPGY